MTLLVSTTTLILAATLSIIVNRQLVPKISVNYVSMVLGGVLAAIPVLNGLVAKFDADVFIGLIVAPLLFFEGQGTRMNSVGRNFRQIISLTVGMVIVCAVVAGFSTAWLTSLGLPLAFILAAISTPTDATATESVVMGLELPRREATSLKLESLFNDASGIILLNMAILWYVNGYINYGQTLGDFLYSALGGVIFGSLVSGVLIYLRQSMLRSRLNFINNTYNRGTPLKVIYMLTPFFLYFGAEELHVSGIIAVVFAGLVHNAEGERSALANPKLAYDSFQLMDLVSDVLNSVVFVVLGIMLVRTSLDKSVTYHGSLIWIGVGVILYVANLLGRYVYCRLVQRRDNRSAWIFALGGIHGAVTFALAFTVAATQVKTQDFNLVLMSESVLIILSMVVPTILFRLMLPKIETDEALAQDIRQVREKMIQRGIDHLDDLPELSDEFKQAVTFDLKSQDGHTTVQQFVSEWRRMVRHPEYTQAEMNLLIATYQRVFKTERQYLIDLYYTQHEVSEELFNSLYREVAMAELMVLDYGSRN
ncbi:sodium:proton antiporter [Levilactobacillus zymae]|uniref:Sodium:proton antiporter n=1 Tax=Levilactobacillus zymae TaxID=267363 RepID=A0ABQ0WYX9_9LACO|nr:sodium:proton antiporter [Levilactobacillus zymae]KRL16402.1 na(+) h(+) antiporter [Levilactobacillus zymae DSM 19395]QFR61786.1 sodium:proton antiporter [Levilactobacillus zymae]GEO72853.1 sodium:proton antiporter [Levilactobacillus zymae]